MKTIVLGSAAGGGYPQWNCRCSVCSLYWNGDARVKRRTQSSIAASVRTGQWVLINCSPDIREQISARNPLHPSQSVRHSPIVAIVITNGDIDHIGGLLSLRESHSFDLWASAAVIAQIEANPIFGVLNRDLVKFNTFVPGTEFEPVAGLEIQSFDVPGKVPLYREGFDTLEVSRNGNTVGLHLRHDGKTLSYVPGCGDIDATLLNDLQQADALLFDGTLWSDDEMLTSNTGQKTGRRMGHVPVSGGEGSIVQLSSLRAKQKYFIHLNNTNPLLVDGSPECEQALRQGWRVAFDGLELMP